MPTAVLAFDFDPVARIGDIGVRWETIGIAAAVFVAIVLAGLGARSRGLRVDDLLFVVLGIVPGAVVGGRLGYVLLHTGYFLAEPVRILDPGLGSLELTLAVGGGAITGSLVAALLDGRPGPWLQASALPMLAALCLGKLATVLGGSGQGVPTTADPATAYLGPGPWGSLGPAIPAVPAQALEGLATAGLLALIAALSAIPRLRRPDGRLFLIALGAWSLVRVVVAGTWRDSVVIGPLRAEQALALAVAVVAFVLALVVLATRRGPLDDGSLWSTQDADSRSDRREPGSPARGGTG